jgi:parallel beta-helix repeat protein/predicted outer membrane repeat protein
MTRTPIAISLIALLTACSPAKVGFPEGVDDTGSTETDGPGDETDTDTDDPDTDTDTDTDTEIDENDVDDDGDGYTENEGDCDDTDADNSPDGEEDPDDGEDNDCDGYTDEVEVCDGVYDNVQEALDDASDGGTVLICPGIYTENLVVSNKELLVVGIDGAESTTINGGSNGSSTITLGNNAEVDFQGLTITGGETPSNGGGIVCSGGELGLIDAVVTANTADGTGGGISATNCDVDISGTTISGNTAASFGGGVYLSDTRGDIENSVIDSNTGFEGGGVFAYDTNTDFTNNTISNNLATTELEDDWGPGGGGGGMWLYTDATIEGNTVSGNTSQYNGGGIYCYYGSPDMLSNTVQSNISWEDGAGVFLNRPSSPLFQGNTVDANEAYDDGGGLRIYYGSNTQVLNNTFSNNIANDDGGGAKFSHSEHYFEGNTVTGNSTGDAGGGLELDNDSTHVEDNTFTGNTAGRGAGLHNWRTETTFDIVNNTFTENVASDCGGAMQFDNNPYWVTVKNVTFEGNEAVDGAAICTDMVIRDPEDVGGLKDYYQESLVRVYNSSFVDNVSGDDAVIYIKAGTLDAQNIVMDGNEGPDSSALVAKGGTISLVNSILTNNTGGAVIAGEADDEEVEATISITYSDLYNNDSGVDGISDPVGSNGNIAQDPDFVGTFELDSSSPCINTGDPGISDTDGSRSDMGMYGGPNAN